MRSLASIRIKLLLQSFGLPRKLLKVYVFPDETIGKCIEMGQNESVTLKTNLILKKLKIIYNNKYVVVISYNSNDEEFIANNIYPSSLRRELKRLALFLLSYEEFFGYPHVYINSIHLAPATLIRASRLNLLQAVQPVDAEGTYLSYDQLRDFPKNV